MHNDLYYCSKFDKTYTNNYKFRFSTILLYAIGQNRKINIHLSSSINYYHYKRIVTISNENNGGLERDVFETVSRTMHLELIRSIKIK